MTPEEELQIIMDFDRAIRVHQDGTITTEPGVFTP